MRWMDKFAMLLDRTRFLETSFICIGLGAPDANAAPGR